MDLTFRTEQGRFNYRVGAYIMKDIPELEKLPAEILHIVTNGELYHAE